MEPKCCSVSVGIRGCVARAIPAKPAQCLPCSRSQNFGPTALENKKTSRQQYLRYPKGVKLLTAFPVRVCGRRPLCQVPSAMAWCLARRTEKRGPLCYSQLGARFRIHSNRPRCGSTIARVQYEYVLAAQLQSTCSEGYTSEDPRALSARTGFRKGLHQIELLCRAEGRQSSRNS